MKRLASFSIQLLLQTAGAVITALLLLYFYMNFQFHEHEERLTELQLEIKLAKNDMLMLRRNEKDFMSRNEEKYHDRLELGIKSFEDKLINIHRVLVVEGIDINSDSLDLIQSIDEYGHSFHELSELLEALNGRNGDKGLFENLKDESIQLERDLLVLHNVELNQMMLVLQEKIYDFYSGISGKEEAAVLFDLEQIFLLLNVMEEEVARFDNETVNDTYLIFKNSFINIQKLHSIAGYNYRLGLHGEIRATIHDVEERLNVLFDTVSVKATNKIDRFFFYSQVLSVVIFLLIVSVLIAVVVMTSRLEKRILRSQNQEIKANKAKSSFLANMSHEIRTPLNGIIGMTEILSVSTLTAIQKDYLATINASSQTLLMLINDVLDLSKIESGNIEVNTHSCKIKEVIFDTAALIAPKAQQKGVNIKIIMSENFPTYVKADEQKIRQVLMNLASNAIKFTEAGSISFELSLIEETDTSYRYFFSVKDTGLGIEESKHEQVFEEFKQEDDDTSKNYGGTGLGLAISSKMIKMMGNEIKLKSSKGVGSEFYFSLELDKDHTPEKASKSRKNKTIIYCSKSPKELFINEVSGYGYHVEKVYSIEEIKVQETSDSLVVLEKEDFQDKIDVVKEKYPRLPIILVRNNTDNNAEIDSVSGYVTYPLLGSRLDNLLHSVFEHSHENETTEVEAKEGEIERGNGMVLIVEDNKINQQVVSINLKMLGIEYKIANNGAEAVELYKRHHEEILVVLMDCMMPVMDGFEATKAIRQLEKNEDMTLTTIIALTASILDDDIQKCFDSGMDDYLPKPFRRESLQEKIAKLQLIYKKR
ncbi:ATP-binding protein [Aliivibrio salmonicida]|uniref:hybrid sensor histidine kinase/response regulator n=1 Tax=Aliivibrio salmonicida TaxID=40269 RepID=UPI003D13996E